MTRSPTELAQRWRERAAELGWEAAYHLRFAADELDSLGLREEEDADFTGGAQTRYVTGWTDLGC